MVVVMLVGFFAIGTFLGSMIGLHVLFVSFSSSLRKLKPRLDCYRPWVVLFLGLSAFLAFAELFLITTKLFPVLLIGSIGLIGFLFFPGLFRP